jgi:hypothetical protein
MKKTEDLQTLIHVPNRDNPLLQKAIDTINKDVEVQTLWKVNNVNAIDRLGMSDHGLVHFQIVANSAIRISRLLKEANVEFSIEKDYKLSFNHSELVIFLASVFHDLGISIHRDGHEEFSLFLANNLLHGILSFMDTKERVIVTSETLHAIISHRSGGRPLTLEAGIVRVADALDMTKGRSRIPYELGNMNIHSISSAAIDDVEIKKGDKKPVQINITMNNSAGIFQIDDLLNSKLMGSGIEKYVSVQALIKRKTEKKLLQEFVIEI